MGLFRKNKREDSEDFILDFHPVGEESPQLVEEDKPTEEVLPAWENREKPHAPHAMTIGEILGEEKGAEGEDKAKITATLDESGKRKPLEQIKAEELEEEPEKAEPLSQKTEVFEAIVPKNQTAQKDNNDKKEIKKPIEIRKADISLPTNIEKTESEQPAEAAKKETPAQRNEAESQNSAASIKAEQSPEKSEPSQKNEPEENKKDITLSPAARALYDRMMAQRAKRQAREQQASDEEAAAPIDEIDAVSSILEPYKETEEEAEKMPSPLEEPSEDKKSGEKSGEKLSDSIFAELSKSLKQDENPLIRKKQNSGESLLSICKNYVTPPSVSDAEDSIDSIIHSAEKGARERLSNFYEIQNSELTPAAGFNPNIFSRDKSELSREDAKRSVSVPVKIVDEEAESAVISGDDSDIKNFQYSFADKAEDKVSTAEFGETKVIDLPLAGGSTPHKTDPAKMEAIRAHLDALANEEVEDIPYVPEKVKLTGNSEAEMPEQDISDYDDDKLDIDDYSSPEDENRVRTDLTSKKVAVAAKLISSSAITLALCLINFAFASAITQSIGVGFAILNIILLGILLIINYSTLKGFTNLIFGSPDTDSPCAFAAVAAFLSTIVSATVMGEKNLLLAPIAGIMLCFNLIGKYLMISRIKLGFETIAGDKKKKAVTFVEDKLGAAVMAGGAVIGEALIASGRECKNVTDFLKNSYGEDIYEKRLKPILLTSIISSFIFAVLGFVFGGLSTALNAFALSALIFCPPSSLLCSELPLHSVSKQLSAYYSMLAGYPAAEAIANANAVAFSAAELFPVGTVKLYNMQVLNRGAVDTYLKSAAAVLSSAGSPLAPIFREMVEESGEKLPNADSIKYENNMGISGWTGEHRVFIGNRTLMEGHNIRVPSLELDKKILREGYFPVYLAFDQQLCALFIIGYEADEEVTYELRRLCSTGVTMLVDSNDPNITEAMLCDYFGLYPDSIKIMSASGCGSYKAATEYRESVSAPASFAGGICGFLSLVTSSIRIKSLSAILLTLQLIGSSLFAAAAIYLLISGGLSSFPSVLIALALLGLTAIIKIISDIYKA